MSKAADSRQGLHATAKAKCRRILTGSTGVHVPLQSARGPAKHLFLRTARSVRACESIMGRANKKRTMGNMRASKAAQNKDNEMEGLGVKGAAARAPTNTAMSPARRLVEGCSEERISTRTHAPHDQPERRPSQCQLDSKRHAAQAQEAHTTCAKR